VLRVNKTSGVVALKLSGFRVPREVLVETDKMITGDPEIETRRSIWWLAAGAFDARISDVDAGDL